MGFYCPHKAIWSDHLAVLALLKASLINLRINHSKNTILKLDDFGQWRLQRQQYWTIWNLKISGKRAKISFYQRTLLFYDMYKCRHATLASQACESTLARPKHGQWYPGSGYEIAKALQAMQLWLSRTLRGIMLLEKLETKAHIHTHSQNKLSNKPSWRDHFVCCLS